MAHSFIKQLLVCIILFLGSGNTSIAQTTIPSSDAPKYAGKEVSFLEMAYTFKYSPSSKTCLLTFPYPGTRDNSPIITIVFHNVNNAKRIHWLKSLQGKWINLTGRLLINKGNFIINGDDLHTKLNEYFGTIAVPEAPPAPSDTTQHK